MVPTITVKNRTVRTIILPLLVHAHCTAALPIPAGDCRGDIGMGCIVSLAIPGHVEKPQQACVGRRFVCVGQPETESMARTKGGTASDRIRMPAVFR